MSNFHLSSKVLNYIDTRPKENEVKGAIKLDVNLRIFIKNERSTEKEKSRKEMATNIYATLDKKEPLAAFIARIGDTLALTEEPENYALMFEEKRRFLTEYNKHSVAQMGNFFSCFKFFGWHKMRVIFVGLDGAGKTTILYRLQVGFDKVVTTIPTNAVNTHIITYKNLKFKIRDLGGQMNPPSWHRYFSKTNAIVYVVDSADRDRVGVANQQLQILLADPKLRDAVLLVMANKQDIHGCLSLAEVHTALGLEAIRNRTFQIFKTSAIVGEGLIEAMEFLADALRNPKGLGRVIQNKNQIISDSMSLKSIGSEDGDNIFDGN